MEEFSLILNIIVSLITVIMFIKGKIMYSCGKPHYPLIVRFILTKFLKQKCCKQHDELYDNPHVSKEEADLIFKNCLTKEGVSAWKIKIALYFVKKYGDKNG